MTASLTLQNISHAFSDTRALEKIDLEIEAGSYVTLLGPSGCGKTTLLSILGGFLEPTQGRVLVGSKDITNVPPAQRPTTTVFQDYALFPHMSVADNVAFGPRMAGMSRRQRRDRAEERLALVGLAGAGRKRPHELSGGQRQRVALARALAVDPEVLLLDEPLGALDLKLRQTMQDELKTIQRRIGTTFVHVTHDQEEAMAIADKIVVMNAGRIEDEGAADRLYRQPASLFSASFLGETNRIPARRTGTGISTPIGTIPSAGSPDADALIVCLRPEALRTDSGSWSLGPCRIRSAAFFGTHCRAQLKPELAPDLTLVAHLPPETRPEPDTIINFFANVENISIFADPGDRGA